MTPRSEHTTDTGAPVPPPATRYRLAGWRDPRLVAGVVVVALSVLGGSVLFAQADDTRLVWGVRRAVPVGAVLTPADLETRRVGIDDEAGRYLAASGSGPVGRTLRREVGAGELLPAGALDGGEGEVGVRVPLEVAAGDVPSSVQVGTVVDVWVVPDEPGSGTPTRAVRAAEQVRVVAISREKDAFAPQSGRPVIVLVPGAPDESALGALIGAAASGRVVLTQSQAAVR